MRSFPTTGGGFFKGAGGGFRDIKTWGSTYGDHICWGQNDPCHGRIHVYTGAMMIGRVGWKIPWTSRTWVGSWRMVLFLHFFASLRDLSAKDDPKQSHEGCCWAHCQCAGRVRGNWWAHEGRDVKTKLVSMQLGVSKNRGTPKSSILIGFSLIYPSILGYHYFWKHLLADGKHLPDFQGRCMYYIYI